MKEMNIHNERFFLDPTNSGKNVVIIERELNTNYS